ncbi:uncharacterized protein BDR25DRAFT_347319 [Lindgomyces ingoldianus]|uniref:Uncharacterized protein n=1 Tax=Lindgomyces ingoldianus TaxID=673940 RepID=A0ACB6QAU8_9PLEO|nr:uncharacterized protein BDR25DRAFT_347319 [Lindgomyces ingoldianus]KAF2463252.1 hypothetical protein BDR25DRAFT_347319 [Lindgomyces ingoldianus]
MRSFAAAAIVGLAAAVPHYGYGYPEESSSVPVYSTPVYSTPEGYPTPSSTAEGYPVPSSSAEEYPTYPSSTAEEYPTYPSSTPVPYVTKTVYQTSLYTVTSCAEYVTNCPAHSTIVYTSIIPAYTTVCPESEIPIYTPPAKPSSTVEAYPTYPVETSAPCSTTSTVTVTIPYSSAAPYYPTGTGAPYYPPGTASSSGYVKPSSYPPTFTGAASHAQVGSFVAGVGAIAALFL